MKLIVEVDFREVKFWKVAKDKPVLVLKLKEGQTLVDEKQLKTLVRKFLGRKNIDIILFRIIFGNGDFANPVLLNDKVLRKMQELVSSYPFYIPKVIHILGIFYKSFKDIDMFLFSDTAFFNCLRSKEGKYALPSDSLGSTNIKRGGFSGLLHSYSLHIAKNKLKIISIVLDSQTTVAAIFKGRPLLVSLGMTPLEGIMGQKSCGDIDPGIIFYLMQKEELNIFQIDNILKEKSGFLGLTGYNIFFKELFSLYGVDKKVTFAFDVYRDQIIKYIGFSLALLEGADAIVFSGKYLDSLRPFIYGLLKRISFLGITLKSLPWQSEGDMVMANSPSSCMSVYLNNLSPVSIISRNSPYSIKK